MNHDIDVAHLKAGEMNLGTSIMAVAFEGGVVIGADSRTTTGSYIVRRALVDLQSRSRELMAR